MHLHFERNVNAKCDCAILSLTWMGKVPDELPEDEGWKLNRTNYYQEGWLATGNVRGIVGVTFTTSHCKKTVDFPLRTNYNLRGHRSEVILVKWNEPYQKLASCDSSGIIFVWIKYEGRWSIELINDRNTPVTHFSWSHDGRMALICYQDGFVLVGSVAGQRYWSSMLNLESTITCGIWTPDDQQVYFGTTAGQIIVMDVHGAMVSQVQLSSEVGITGMAWSCEKFKMEEGDDIDVSSSHSDEKLFVLAVSLQNGYIFLMKSYDDVSPIQVHTGLYGPLSLEWSNSRELLAVAGTIQQQSVSTQHTALGTDSKNIIEYTNILKFYSDHGVLLYSTIIPNTASPVTALTWGHNDKRLFIATGCLIHIAWVSRRVASLQLLCRLQIHSQLRGETQVSQLPLPIRIKTLISNLFAQTIRCCVPESSALRDFVSRPPDGSVRLHCTMIRHDEDSNLSSGTCYTLYLEYLGGLVPLLKGKRTSKIRPEFVIYDPQVDDMVLGADSTDSAKSSGSSQNAASDTDSDREEGCSSPRVQRRKRRRNKSHSGVERVTSTQQHEGDDDLTYIDTLPENARLVEVTSNIWGTKFKIHGLASCVPANLGQVTYKTSLLHLQPRQMTLLMTELRDDFPLGPDPSFNPNLFSEDEDEPVPSLPTHHSSDISPPIAPMTPRLNTDRKERSSNLQKNQGLIGEIQNRPRNLTKIPMLEANADFQNRNIQKAVVPTPFLEQRSIKKEHHITSEPQVLANVESYDEEHQPVPNFCETLRAGSSTFNNGSGAFAISQYRPNIPVQAQGKPVLNLNLNLNALDQRLQKRCDLTDNNAINKRKEKHLNKSSPSGNQIGIAATKWCVNKPEDLLYIDEDINANADKVISISPSITDSMVRSCSVGYLDLVDAQLVPCEVALLMLRKETPKRLVLVNRNKNKQRRHRSKQDGSINTTRSPKLKHCRKSKSLDSGDLFPATTPEKTFKPLPPLPDLPKIPTIIEDSVAQVVPVLLPKDTGSKIPFFNSRKKKDEPDVKATPKTKRKSFVAHLESLSLITRTSTDTPPNSPCPSPRLPRSSPASPMPTKKGKRNQSSSPIRKHILNSPLLNRRKRSNKTESSDDEVVQSGDALFDGKNYHDLESFQKSQLRQKLKRGGKGNKGESQTLEVPLTPPPLRRREFVMHNKAPMWNENSQVYQLDFGGRVTQESAKNFQIEFRGKQVMQFGRIDGNAYTLDFQYPFSALQAFAVALANVTQRLK